MAPSVLLQRQRKRGGSDLPLLGAYQIAEPDLHAISVPREALRLPWGRIEIRSQRKPQCLACLEEQLSRGRPEAYQSPAHNGVAVEICLVKGLVRLRLLGGDTIFDEGARAVTTTFFTAPFGLSLRWD